MSHRTPETERGTSTPSTAPHGIERVAELEASLRRIGAEVVAAGLLSTADPTATLAERSALSELTTRQAEILSLLLQGQRVPSIAEELYVSPSTVRNHLSAIFRKFGIHSQSELIERLRHSQADAQQC